MPRLRELAIWSLPELTDEQFATLSDASWLGKKLETLMMLGGEQLAKHLGATKKLTGLHTISVTGAEGSVSAEMLRALLDSVGDGALTTLDCSSAWFDEDAVSVLASHEAMKLSLIHI